VVLCWGRNDYGQRPTLALAPSSLSNADRGSAYSQTFSTSGGASPYAYAVVSGTLPPGVELGYFGTLSGTPTLAGTYNFVVRSTDNNYFAVEGSYSILVVDHIRLPLVMRNY
jgi:hypothetical protein